MAFRKRPSAPLLAELIAEIEPLKQGFDKLSFPAVITDQDANILYVNAAVEKQTGFSAAESIGKNPADLWGGLMDKPFYEKMWDTILNQKMPYVVEVKNHHKNGQEYWQELQISPVLHQNGEVRFFIGIEPNITDRKERERFREEFVSLLAHQLRNPLTSIRWSLSVLLDKGGLTAGQKEVLEDIYHNDKLLIDLIADFLVITRIGTLKPENIILDLTTIINDLITQARAAHPRVTISFVADGAFPLETPTKQLVSQVFANLITNAVKYADDKEGKVTVSLAKNGAGYSFAVENNGPPIPETEKDKIFTKLYRGSTAVSRNISGTGLGLYIVKLICDNFSWEVDFESPKVGGSTTIFTVNIPTREITSQK